MKNPCKGCEDKYRSCEEYCPKMKEIKAEQKKKREQKTKKVVKK